MNNTRSEQFILRRSKDRGQANYGWLDTRYSFSFAHYYDPDWLGFCSLRVLNEDHIAPGGGFPRHPHREMEIITYILSGTIEHRDSMGSSLQLKAGDVQVMSAGTGLQHSEFNPSAVEDLHLLQIWILPATPGISPRYDQRTFPLTQRSDHLQLLAAPLSTAESHNALSINADAKVFGGYLLASREVVHPAIHSRAAWIQVVLGDLVVNSQDVSTGDGLGVYNSEQLNIMAKADAEFLLFDLPGK